ncbi:MAG: TolC family protein [Bacteroidales bacterium]|nr:TolC family protein [Bacteroidales bacterium]
MKRILFILSLAALVLPSSAQTRLWSLEDCIRYALDNNITLKQNALNVEQREIELNTYLNSRLPAVSAAAGENLSFGRGLTADNTYANSNTSNTSFSVGADVPVFNGNRINNSIAMGRLNLKAATEDLEKARDDIRVAVAQAFVQILYNGEILEVARRQVEIDSLQAVRLEKMALNGKASKAQVSAQKASLAKSRVSEVQASNNYRISILDLTQLLELTDPENFNVLKPSGDADPSVLLPGPDAIYQEAIGIKPVVLAEQTRLDYAARNIDYAKGAYLPSLSFSAGLGSNYYTNSRSPSAAFFQQLGTNFSQYLGLSLNIPIFSRFSTRNNVRSAQVNFNNQKLQLDNVKKQLYKEIQQAYYNALASESKFESSILAEESAKEAFSLMQGKYENGKATITEFNESKEQYLEAASNLVQARYEFLYLTRLLDFYRGKELVL